MTKKYELTKDRQNEHTIIICFFRKLVRVKTLETYVHKIS